MKIILDNHSPVSLASFIKKATQFRIPDFQRAYAWKKSQAEALIKAMELTMQNGKHHFFGTIIYSPEASYWHLIDGQQRITTTLLFLAACCHELYH